MTPQFDPLFVRSGWNYGVENGTNHNLVLIFLFDFHTHNMPILHRLATIHNAQTDIQTTDRQTDRAIGIGRLCDNIGGLKVN